MMIVRSNRSDCAAVRPVVHLLIIVRPSATKVNLNEELGARKPKE